MIAGVAQESLGTEEGFKLYLDGCELVKDEDLTMGEIINGKEVFISRVPPGTVMLIHDVTCSSPEDGRLNVSPNSSSDGLSSAQTNSDDSFGDQSSNGENPSQTGMRSYDFIHEYMLWCFHCMHVHNVGLFQKHQQKDHQSSLKNYFHFLISLRM
jgi:hypothetical protein